MMNIPLISYISFGLLFLFIVIQPWEAQGDRRLVGLVALLMAALWPLTIAVWLLRPDAIFRHGDQE